MSFTLDRVGLIHPGGNAPEQRALRAVSIDAARGERLAIIGPSGAGKTSLLRILASAIRPTEGRVSVLGQNPWQLTGSQLKRLRSRIGFVRQSPPLPPRQRAITAVIAGRLGEWPWWKSALSLIYPVDIAGPRDELARLDLADRLFDRCDRLSGGQLQRVGVARVLYQRPDLLLADEPISALDVSVQAQIINLLDELREKTDTAFLFIAHDLAVVEHISSRILVMYLGHVVESGPSRELCDAPRHPYSRSLLSAVPMLERPAGHQRIVLQGDVPSPLAPPAGCPFHPRCPLAVDRCRSERPQLEGDGEHQTACFRAGETF